MSNENNDLNATAALSLAINTGTAADQLKALRLEYDALKTAFASELDGSKATQQMLADNKKLREEVNASRKAIVGLKEDLQRANDKASTAAGEGMGKLRTAVSGLSQSTAIATKDMTNFNAVTGRLKNEIVALATAGVDLGSVIKGVKLDSLNGDKSVKSLNTLIKTLDEAKRASDALSSKGLSAPENLNRVYGQGVNELIANLDKIKAARDSLIGRQEVAKAVGESNARLVAEMQKGMDQRKKLQAQEVKDFGAYKQGLAKEQELSNAVRLSVFESQNKKIASALQAQKAEEERLAANTLKIQLRSAEMAGNAAIATAERLAAEERKRKDKYIKAIGDSNRDELARIKANNEARVAEEERLAANRLKIQLRSAEMAGNAAVAASNAAVAEEKKKNARLLQEKKNYEESVKQQTLKSAALDLRFNSGSELADAKRRLGMATTAQAILATAGVGGVSQGDALAAAIAKVGPAATFAASNLAPLTAEVERLRSAKTKLAPAVKAATDHQIHWNKVSNEAHALARGLSGSLGALWITYGSLAPLIAGAAIAGSMKAVVTAGKEVEFQLTFVKAITEGTAVSFDDLAKSMEGSLFTPVEATKGLRTLAQAGLSTEEALAALPNVLKLATVGETDMANAALSATSIMHTFGKSVNDIGNIGDVFGKAAAISATSVREMMEAMKQAAAISSVFGVSMEETAAALATLANRGIEGSAAGTAVRNMVKELAAPATEKAASAMKQVGIEIFNADGSAKSFTENLQQLKDAVASMDSQSKAKFLEDLFNERGAKAAAILLQDMEKMEKSLKDIKLASDGLGFMTEASLLLSQSVEGMSKSLASGFQVTLVDAFKAVEPEIKSILASMTSLVTSAGFKEFMRDTAEIVAGLTRALVDNGKEVLLLGTAYLAFQGSSAAISAVAASTAYFSTVMKGAAVSASAFSGALFAAQSGMGSWLAVVSTGAARLAALALPIAGVAAGIAGIGVAAYALTSSFSGLSEEQRRYLSSVEGLSDGHERLAKATELSLKQAETELEAYRRQVQEMGRVKGAMLDLAQTKLDIEREEAKRNRDGAKAQLSLVQTRLINSGFASDADMQESRRLKAVIAQEDANVERLAMASVAAGTFSREKQELDKVRDAKQKIIDLNTRINDTLKAGENAQRRLNEGVKGEVAITRAKEAVARATSLRKQITGKADGYVGDVDPMSYSSQVIKDEAARRLDIVENLKLAYSGRAEKASAASKARVKDLFEQVHAERLLAEEKARAAEVGEVADTATFKAKAAINKAYMDGERLSANYVMAVLEEAEAHDKVNEKARLDAEHRKTLKEMTEAQAAFVAESRKGNATLEEQLRAGELELSMIGKTAEEKEKLTAASKEQQAVIADEIAAVYEAAAAYAGLNDNYVMKTSGDSYDTYSALAEQSRRRAELLRQIAANDRNVGAAKAGEEARAASEAEAKRIADETRRQWNRLADDVEKWLSDSLYNAFENGKGFGESFAESLKSTLLRTSFRIAVDAIVNPVMNQFRSALGVGGQQQGLNIPGFGSTGGLYTSFATSGLGQTLGLSQAADLGMVMTEAGGAAAAAEAGATLTSLGSSVGAALPWVGGAIAVASMLGAFEDDGPAMRRGTFRQGGNGDYNYRSVFGNFSPWDNNEWFGDGMAGANNSFANEITSLDKLIADTLELKGADILKVSHALRAAPAITAEFGMEGTDWTQSTADEQFKQQRYSIVAKALGKSIEEITAVMSGSYNQLRVDLAKPIVSKLSETLAQLDAQANFRAGTDAEIGTIRGTLTLDKRIADLQSAMAKVTASAEWLSMAEQVRSLIVERYDAEVAKIEEAKQKANELGDALVGVSNAAKALLLSDLSPLTNSQRLAEASTQYQALLAGARAGDVNAVGNLSGAAQSYLTEARTMYASSGTYSSIFSDVQGTLAALGLTSDSARGGSWQTQLIDLQNSTAEQLGELNVTSEAFTEALETKATEQLEELRKLNLTQQQTNTLLEGVDQRISDLITAVQKMEGTVATTTQKTGDKTARAIAELAANTTRN